MTRTFQYESFPSAGKFRIQIRCLKCKQLKIVNHKARMYCFECTPPKTKGAKHETRN